MSKKIEWIKRGMTANNGLHMQEVCDQIADATTEINNSTITVKVTHLTSAGMHDMYIGSKTTNVGKGASNINVISATGLLGATVTASTSYNNTTGVLTVNATSTNSEPVMVRISVMKGV